MAVSSASVAEPGAIVALVHRGKLQRMRRPAALVGRVRILRRREDARAARHPRGHACCLRLDAPPMIETSWEGAELRAKLDAFFEDLP